MAKKKKARIAFDQSDGFGSSLGAQLGLRAPDTTASDPPAKLESSPTMPADAATYRIELRVSRRGYGGKTVTECRGMEAADKATKAMLSRSLSKTLGVRVFWKDEICCVQGDQVGRLMPYFTKEGHEVRSVST